MPLLTHCRPLSITMALALAGLLGACSWHPNSLYVETEYSGVWRIEVTSERCGNDVLERYYRGPSFSFNVYEKKYKFNFTIKDRKALASHKPSALTPNVFTGELSRALESPGVNLSFTSSSAGTGIWHTADCDGEIAMRKISG